jgi:multidrug resistance efflux pump
MKIKYFNIYLVATLCVSILISCKEKKTAITPIQQDITHSIYASVTVKPDHLYTVYPQQTGIISEIFVTEGDSVYAGQKIGSIINDNIELNQEKAALQYQLAESKLYGQGNTLKTLQSEIESLKSQVQYDSINYFKNLKLEKEKVVTKTALDNYKLKYELSTNQLSNSQQKYIQIKKELENSLEQSKTNLKVAKINLNDSYIYSLIDGMIYSVEKEIGEFISSQIPFGQIGSKNNFVIEMLVDEEDITQIKIGQKVVVSLDAYADTSFMCEITKIYPQKDLIKQTFTVEGIFLEQPATVLFGMSGESNIIIDHQENAIVIPREYLNDKNQVNTKEGLITVKTGLKDMNHVQILDGITVDTKIFPLDEN